MSKKLPKELAVRLSKSEFWLNLNNYQIALFQLSFETLCMPWNVFHEAVEFALNRDVYNHEFRDLDGLKEELLGNRPAPTIEEILSLLPSEKLLKIHKREI